MIEGLRSYPEYKESGNSWLGYVPSHWQIRRIKASVANEVDQTNSMGSDDVYVALENIESWSGRVRPQRGENLFTGQVKRFRPNDILFGKLRPYLAKVTRLDIAGVCVGELFVLRPRDASLIPEFLEHLLRSKRIIDVVNSSTFGAKMPRADWQYVGNLVINFPPPFEQTAIVRFLDHANQKIDRFIRAKRKLIALLNEQKQAIIHHAVTRGLNPDAPLKPSGIPWLGDIPAHWESVRCGSLFREVVDVGHPNAALLSIDRHKGIIPQHETGRRTRASRDRGAYKRVQKGQLAYNIMNAFMGALGFSEYDGIVCPAYAVAQPQIPLETRYYHHLLRTPSYTAAYNQLSYGIMYERNRLYFDRFKLVPALVPPTEEQALIADWIAENTSEINTAITRTEREIALMQEYRTRLTADIVTGKLDVREAAANLPGIRIDQEPVPDDSTDQEEAETDPI